MEYLTPIMDLTNSDNFIVFQYNNHIQFAMIKYKRNFFLNFKGKKVKLIL